jgi:regulator of protease activity HflC (stomatin/prohibitin superfamily)
MSLPGRLLDRIGERALLRLTLGVLLFALIFLYYAPNIVHTIPAGHIGVRWSRFFGGTVLDRIYREGIHFILPWDKMIVYDARIKHEEETYEALTIDGLQIQITFDIRHRLIEERIPYLHKYIGENYINVLLAPTVGAYARRNIARYTAEEVYATQRLFIEQSILAQLRQRYHVDVLPDLPRIRFIDYDQVLIHRILLPESVQAAIENKIGQYHVTLEWQFRLQREQLEAQRRLIQARATAEVADLLHDKLSDAYLRLRSIEALLQLAASPGSRTVVLGQSGGILPVVPTGDAAAVGPAAGVTPASPASATVPGLATIPAVSAVPPDVTTMPPVSTVPPGVTTTPPASTMPGSPQRRRRRSSCRRPRRARGVPS